MHFPLAVAIAASLIITGCSDKNTSAESTKPDPAETRSVVTPTATLSEGLMAKETASGAPPIAASAGVAEASFPVALRGAWRETSGGAPTAAQCEATATGNIGKVLVIRDTGFNIFEEAAGFSKSRTGPKPACAPYSIPPMPTPPRAAISPSRSMPARGR